MRFLIGLVRLIALGFRGSDRRVELDLWPWQLCGFAKDVGIFGPEARSYGFVRDGSWVEFWGFVRLSLFHTLGIEGCVQY